MTTSRLDARGRACPIPIVQLRRALDSLAPGDVIEVLADDDAFPADVEAWCRKVGHELVSFEGSGGSYQAHVRKGSAP
jgi:TusA-related sulfurtransferase